MRNAHVTHINIVTYTRETLLALVQRELIAPKVNVNPFPRFAIARSTAENLRVKGIVDVKSPAGTAKWNVFDMRFEPLFYYL